MALSCLAGAPLGSRTSGPGSTASGRGMKEGAESEGGLRRATPGQPPSGPEKVLASAGGPGQVVSPPGGVSNLVGPSGSLPLPLFSTQQAVAAGLFGASMGSLGHGSLRLPALMASLQAAAGVGVLPLPLRPNSGLSLLGHGAGYPGGPLFPSISQHNALLTWTKLAQTNAALGVDVSQGGLVNSIPHSPDLSRPPSSKSYTGTGTGRERIRDPAKLDKNARTRTRDVKERRIDYGRREKKIGLDEQTKSELDPEPEASSPAGTSSPPSNGSSGGKSAESGRKSRGTGETGRDKVFSCSICNRTFGYKHVLQNHERTHTGEKPFECKQCGKRFTRDHHLKTHMRLHTGEKPYNCTHCDRQFVQVANLRRHLRVHTGERPYACELCTSRFSDSNQLKAHMLIHKGEKPFACEHCSGRFRRRHHLVHHKCPKDTSDGVLHSKRGRPLIMADEDEPEDEPPGTPPSYSDELMETEDTLERPSTVASSRSRSRSRSRTPSVITEPITSGLVIQPEKKRERKPRETRRFVRHNNAINLSGPALMSNLPEQTEPEDLSMASGSLRTEVRVRHPSAFSASSASGWSITGSISDRIGGLVSEEEESSDNEVHAPKHHGMLLMEAPGPIDLVRSRKPQT